MKSVEELDVFKLAHDLTLKIYKITLGFPRQESFNLVSQIRRAASSDTSSASLEVQRLK